MLVTKERAFYKRLLQLAVPICLQSIIMIGISLVDTIIPGQLGDSTLAASSLANQFCFVFQVLCFGIVCGAGVMTGQYWGNKDIESINKTMAITFKLVTIVSLAFFLLAQFYSVEIISIYSREAEVIRLGGQFLRIISFSFLFTGWSTVMAILLRTVGIVRLTLLTTIITFICNLFLNWVLVFGRLGMPAMGIEGSATATTVSRTLEIIIMFVFLFAYDRKIKFRLRYLVKTDFKILKEYAKIGMPVIVSDFVLVIGTNMLAVIMGQMGREMVAANAIVNVLAQLTTVLLMGVASSGSVIVGNTIGAGEIEKARLYGRTCWLLSIAIGLVGGLLIFLLKDIFISSFFPNINASTYATTIQLMDSMALLIVFFSASFTLTKGILRAGGDTIFLMVADVLFIWLVSVPLGYYTGIVLHLAPGIVLIFLRLDEVIKTIWCSVRLLGRHWIKNIALETEKIETGG